MVRLMWDSRFKRLSGISELLIQYNASISSSYANQRRKSIGKAIWHLEGRGGDYC